MVRLVSPSQIVVLQSSAKGKELLQAYESAAQDVTKLGQTNAYRKGGKQDEMETLMASRTARLGDIKTFLQSARAESLQSADARLAQIAALTVGAQHDVHRAMDTERMDFAPIHSLKNMCI